MTYKFANLKPVILSLAIGVAWLIQCSGAQARDMQTLTVAGGCFWCVESDFERVPGVSEVISGYTGGSLQNPTYENHEGHVEAVQIHYDADQISARQLYDLFFRSIDPTDAGGQFCDRGHAYTTAIFVSNPAEQQAAEAAKSAAQAALGQTIVTPIRQASQFWQAEDYHQDYYRGENIVLTRRGPKSQSNAYAFYRNACGRDQRVEQLWGSDAPFIHH